MKTIPAFRSTVPVLMLSAFALIAQRPALAVPPPTFWTGPTTNYTQTSAALADTIISTVALCRGASGPLFNVAQPYHETFSDGSTSPKDTMWAIGTMDTNNPSAVTNFSYQSFASFRNSAGGDLSTFLVPPGSTKPMVLHITNENIYIAVTFTAWHQHSHITNAGPSFVSGFSYTRSTPAAVVVAPTLGISSPANNSVFATPANVQITATVTNGSSPVTNVSFFANGSTFLGSKTNSPFTVSSGNLSPGPYALTAVATAGGVNATSAVVNISVVAPPTLGISSPTDGAVFAAPVNLQLAASVTNGTSPVTNVSFFANGSTLLGSTTNSPFTVASGNLSPGSYALTAVATAGGVNATSAVVNISVVAPPTLGISSPTNGAVFAAPANLQIAAAVTNGTAAVTNVSFFANGTTSLGSTNSAPFNILTASLPAGGYALTAVATAGGISATSAVVNVSVINPVVVSNAPPQIANGNFSFNFAADTGLQYVVQSSSNLVDWIPVVTNTATGGSVPFSDSFVSNANRYYRVARLPNP